MPLCDFAHGRGMQERPLPATPPIKTFEGRL